ncbi:hypothetical protein POM88_028889 [Heracleum sosnowskyi]|uniref:Uncharacterized protein n=1 Tax=Heracleum sosnowskyi TaxID=360622 RepID=A0AAD8HT31_9APIA|nr:hypothetical protein POM88_028889 [Heracleum sosnowskyi]
MEDMINSLICGEDLIVNGWNVLKTLPHVDICALLFNCSNRDVFRWKHFWKVLGEQFEVECGSFESGERFSLAEMMKDKGPVWDKIVEEKGLVPTKLEEVAAWWFADGLFNCTCPLNSIQNLASFIG